MSLSYLTFIMQTSYNDFWINLWDILDKVVMALPNLAF